MRQRLFKNADANSTCWKYIQFVLDNIWEDIYWAFHQEELQNFYKLREAHQIWRESGYKEEYYPRQKETPPPDGRHGNE